MLKLPVGPWLPDLPDLNNPGIPASGLLNAMPRSPKSYGPVRGLVPNGAPIDSACRGAIAAQDVIGIDWVFAGSQSELWAQKGNTIWINVGSGYNVPPGESWRFDQFKNWIIATNYSDPIQYFDMGGSTPTFTPLAPIAGDGSGAPTQARHIAVVHDFVMVANTIDPVGGVAPFRSWWSAIDNAQSWPVPGSNLAVQEQSDYNDIVGAEGGITGLVSTLNGSDGAMFYARGLFRIMYVGPQNVFDFQPVSGARGTVCSNAIVHVGGLVYYIGEDGLYAFDGVQSTPIGQNQVDRWFFQMVNPLMLSSVVGAWDPLNRVVTFAFPSVNSTTLDSLLFYSTVTERFGYAQMPLEWIVKVLYGGGQQQAISAFNPAHQLCGFTGPLLAATIGTTEGQPFAGRSALVRGLRPLVDGGNPSASIQTRMRPMDALITSTAQAMDATGFCPQRAEGRYARALVQMQAGDTWTHFSGVEVDAVPTGER